jgi:hypothetical protein
MAKNRPMANKDEFNLFKEFKRIYDIQKFLDNTKYNPLDITNSPKLVIQNNQANCFEGALFAAAVLKVLGYKPLIVDMMAENDDDHVIAVFKQNNLYGAVAKSNTTLLRFREPVYRTVRELVMSYFDFYFNVDGEKSLRSYTNPVNLSRFDRYNWVITDDDLGFIGDYLFEVYHHNIIDRKSIRSLNNADEVLIKICFQGSVEEGLFKPLKKKKKSL